MFCAVYLLRRKGEKVHPDEMKQSQRRGEVRYAVRVLRGNYRVMKAQLLASDGVTYIAPVLDQARVVKIAHGGILISGTEIIPLNQSIKNIKAEYWPQTWWCIPQVSPELALEDAVPLASREMTWRERGGKEHADTYLRHLTNPVERRRR